MIREFGPQPEMTGKHQPRHYLPTTIIKIGIANSSASRIVKPTATKQQY